MKKLSIDYAGETLEVMAMRMAGKVWFHLNGETHVFSPKGSSAGRSNAAASVDPTQIVAPMPGKIIKIFVQKEQIVEEGETLIAMEAMKMEYNLKALQKMKVKKILCTEMRTVGLGDQLMVLEDVDV